MHRVGIYTVYDRVAEDVVGGMLQLHKHEAVAVRSFTDIVSDKRTQMAQHPKDFDLVRLGFLEDGKLVVAEHTVVVNAGTIVEALAQQQQEATK